MQAVYDGDVLSKIKAAAVGPLIPAFFSVMTRGRCTFGARKPSTAM
ncbi:MAG: hypothetical protein L6V88_03675 [Anaerotruncus sp.]|nr:MAG: hypothetical protein L6V88_03675 [Anaerotruncus sp.]